MSERDFIGHVRAALDDSLERLDAATRARLSGARHEALAARRRAPAGAGALALVRHHPRALALAFLLCLALAAWFGMRPRTPPEGGNVDIELLTGDIPPQVYADWRLVRREDVGSQCLTPN